MIHAVSRIEGKYPIIESNRWSKGRKKELLKVLEACNEKERQIICKTLNLNQSEIQAIEESQMEKPDDIRKSIDKMGEQIAELITKGNPRTEIGDITGKFTNQEQDILRILKLYNGKVVDKKILHSAIQLSNGNTEGEIVNVLICKIRAKFEDSGQYDIETVWGRGYRLYKKENT